ncbi:hypothetical protein ACFOLA_03070 [Salinicoccus hispanicus]|uniref:Uncharacterized protein n=1 Tax=Salinicoccus hispanicus TaxID=157225 RepID=A0A6N8TXU0_9STAP|nr:hypothetical protein [Salinicoccus hispanicus]MXQ50560.1 hypothetical protein [Salinicoccus hispanicus]
MVDKSIEMQYKINEVREKYAALIDYEEVKLTAPNLAENKREKLAMDIIQLEKAEVLEIERIYNRYNHAHKR